MVREKCEGNVKIFLFRKDFFSKITTIHGNTVVTDPRFILSNYCLKGMFQMEPHFL